MKRIEGRVAVVTGAGSGFGRGLVSELLARGWTVYAGIRNAPSNASSIPAQFQADSDRFPGRLHLVGLDVTQTFALTQLRQRLQTECPQGIDALYAVAGVGLFGPFEETSDAQLREVFEVNFFGTLSVVRGLLPELRKRQGRIITVSSVFGRVGFPMNSVYCGSKFALEGVMESLAHELRPHGVKVVLVEPGRFRTRFASNARWAEGIDDPASPYRAQSAAFRKFNAKLTTGQGIAPLPVFRKLAALGDQAHPPLRVRIGRDAAFFHWTARILPSRLWLGMLGQVFKRLLATSGTPC